MTRTQIRNLLEIRKYGSGSLFSDKFNAMRPLLEKYAAGEKIQHKNVNDERWTDGEGFDFCYDADRYRVKPPLLPKNVTVTINRQEYEIDVQKAVDLGLIKI